MNTWIKNPPEPPGLEVINWSQAYSSEKLLSWIPEDYRLKDSKGRPISGRYYLTGFENTGKCWWCGSELTGRQLKYCRTKEVNKEGHWYMYYKHFAWSWARDWCIERYDHRCSNCGRKEGEVIVEGERLSEHFYRGRKYLELEVHHIIPLNGEERQWTPFNLPWNLIAFCHDCHLQAHAAMRPPRYRLDSWDRRIAAGQLCLLPDLIKEKGGVGNEIHV